MTLNFFVRLSSDVSTFYTARFKRDDLALLRKESKPTGWALHGFPKDEIDIMEVNRPNKQHRRLRGKPARIARSA